jgi:Spy/CpxP family protein refolding chaperone
MNTRHSFALFVLLFGLGVVAGSTYTSGSAVRMAPKSHPSIETIVNNYLARQQAKHAEDLGLTLEQLTASGPALEAARAKLITQQRETRRKVFRIMEQYRADLGAVLTPEQQEKLDRIMEQYRKKSPARPAAN